MVLETFSDFFHHPLSNFIFPACLIIPETWLCQTIHFSRLNCKEKLLGTKMNGVAHTYFDSLLIGRFYHLIDVHFVQTRRRTCSRWPFFLLTHWKLRTVNNNRCAVSVLKGKRKNSFTTETRLSILCQYFDVCYLLSSFSCTLAQ